ncbi:hypothetical protein ACDF64_01935 [Agromyces sp. MMS24-JH15]|uniref:hypothetical protein n=1 Tax=Agromyces sp. MMS24-JH15 TaxID=3243765 RepID=UPI0037486DB4
MFTEDLGDPEDAVVEGSSFLGAVRQLVSADRAATKADLILAAASHALRSGPKTLPEVTAVVNLIWPGASTDEASVLLALDLGKDLSLVVPSVALDDSQLWQLTARGADDVDQQAGWVRNVQAKARVELAERAQEELAVSLSDDQSALWLERIVSALISGIQASQDAYLGNVDHLVGKRLHPKTIDYDRVLAGLTTERGDKAVEDFLRASALAALDPMDTFGSDLVSYITTGCVLHSYVAGRDAAGVLEQLGDPTGQRALVDTPVLIELLGPDRIRTNTLFTINAALKAGWDIVVCEHSLEELEKVIRREIPRVIEDLRQAHEAGVKQEWYASLTDGELPSYCIEAFREGSYHSPDDVIDAAVGLREKLTDLGVIVRPHHNDEDAARVQQCREALEAVLAGGLGGRSAQVMQRDADSMALIWRRRRRQRGTSQWPGGWIITTDRHISPAYRMANPHDKIPLALSMAQWSTLLSVSVPPADVVELAEAAAAQLVEEAMWLLPARFPSEIAMSLATQISPRKGGTDLDLRYAQLTLDAELDNAATRRTATSLAADVLEARTRRNAHIQQLQMNEKAVEVAEANRKAATAHAIAAEHERLSTQSATRVTELDLEKQALANQLNWANKRLGRILWSFAIGVVGVISILVIALVGAGPLPIGISIAGLLVLIYGLYKWCSAEDVRIVPTFVGAAIETLGIVGGIVGLAVDVPQL